MMFSLKNAVTEYTWPVDVQVPSDGKYLPYRFKGRFALLQGDDAGEVREMFRSGQFEELELTRRVFIGWPEGEVGDEEGNPLPPDADNIETMIQLPYVRKAILDAYIDSLQGRKAARKN